MKPSILGLRVLGALLLGGLCGGGSRCGSPSVIDNSRFDKWVDGVLSNWEIEYGEVRRVDTWHARDYAAELVGADVRISQFSDERVDCLQIDLVADIAASTQVTLELDYNDDGTIDRVETIPRAAWKRLQFLVTPPVAYENVRFALRKRGDGRAVVAQLRAVQGEGCQGEPIAVEVPRGVACEVGQEMCGQHACGVVATLGPSALFGTVEPYEVASCTECVDAAECTEGASCVLVFGRYGVFRECRARHASGALCLQAEDCAEGFCSELPSLSGMWLGRWRLASYNPYAFLPLIEQAGVCSGCGVDDDCADGEVCAVDLSDRASHFKCMPAASRQLGELCERDVECGSGTCCEGQCAECCGGVTGCDRCEVATTVAGETALFPLQCAPGSEARASGEACFGDDDCESGTCQQLAELCPHPWPCSDVPSRACEHVCPVGVMVAGTCL